ncbi:MAG: hypothetical protein CMK05_00800 [Ponticaulis sp.]|nr:hypothetical protein [Ponticaulis sp.]
MPQHILQFRQRGMVRDTLASSRSTASANSDVREFVAMPGMDLRDLHALMVNSSRSPKSRKS